MVCHWSSSQWLYVPTKEHYVIGEVDEESHKIFEAFYGIPVTPAPFPEFQYFASRKTRVKAVTNDDDTTSYAKFAVDQYNNKKRENQPSLSFLRVVGAVCIRPPYWESHFLITLQALDEPTKTEPTASNTQPKPRKFFAKVSVYDCLHCKTKHLESVEWLPVDDDLTQLKSPLYTMRKEKKRFLKEMAARLEQEKQKFVEKINVTLGHMVQPEDKGAILKVILADLESEMHIKQQNELKFEPEEAYAILLARPKVGVSSFASSSAKGVR